MGDGGCGMNEDVAPQLWLTSIIFPFSGKLNLFAEEKLGQPQTGDGWQFVREKMAC